MVNQGPRAAWKFLSNIMIYHQALSWKNVRFFINYLIALKIDFNISQCENGEIIKNMQCLSCPQGYYSFENNSTKCKKCFEHGVCLGKNFTQVKPGYWRET